VHFSETDGHKTESKYEHALHAAFVGLNWTHEPHPKIPGTEMVADFLVENEVWIEVFGLADTTSPEYQRKIRIKQKLNEARDNRFVEFYPTDFNPRNRGALTRKLVEIQEKFPPSITRPRLSSRVSKRRRILTFDERASWRVYALTDDEARPQLEDLDAQIELKEDEIQHEKEDAERRAEKLKDELQNLHEQTEALLRSTMRRLTETTS
jgi:hypothetical protein